MVQKNTQNPQGERKADIPKGELHILPEPLAAKIKDLDSTDRGKMVVDKDHNLFRYPSEEAAEKAVWDSMPLGKKAGAILRASTLGAASRAGETLLESGKSLSQYARENAVSLSGMGLASAGCAVTIANATVGLGMVATGAAMVVGREIYDRRRQK